MSKVLVAVEQVRARQDEIWGEQNRPPCEWMTILGAEYGEACQQALAIRFESSGAIDDYRKKLIQVAALAVAAVECIDRGKWS